MKSIKTIAGRVLLYFYTLQRADYSKLYDLVLEFQMRDFADKNARSPRLIGRPGKTAKGLLSVAGSDNNLYNAIKYLEDKGFIKITNNRNKTCDNLTGLSAAAAGIDIIEGVERGEKEKDLFYATFNIKLSAKIKLEALLQKYQK